MKIKAMLRVIFITSDHTQCGENSPIGALSFFPIFILHRFGILDLRYSVNLIKIDRAQPPARRGCSAYASESDTINPSGA